MRIWKNIVGFKQSNFEKYNFSFPSLTVDEAPPPRTLEKSFLPEPALETGMQVQDLSALSSDGDPGCHVVVTFVIPYFSVDAATFVIVSVLRPLGKLS